MGLIQIIWLMRCVCFVSSPLFFVCCYASISGMCQLAFGSNNQYVLLGAYSILLPPCGYRHYRDMCCRVLKKWDFLFIYFIWFQELQQLGEAIGTESKGLPESVIALLPTSTYKIGIFSRKEKHDEYVFKLIRIFIFPFSCSTFFMFGSAVAILISYKIWRICFLVVCCILWHCYQVFIYVCTVLTYAV